MSQQTLKICIAASSGGHLSQLLKLASSYEHQDIVCVTTKEETRKKLETYGPVYVVGECNREHPFKVLSVLFKSIKVLLKHRPDIVISTGAAVGCISCFLGKMLGAKVLWIDSITNVERLSMSGRMVRHIADVFLVQWPELAEKYDNAEYCGAVI